MFINRKAITGAVAAFALAVAAPVFAQETQPSRDTRSDAKSSGKAQSGHEADNTKVNERDRAKTSKTADQAKNNSGDRDLMQKIRQSIVDDKSLSSYAHNVKVIARNGKITLKGPVRSEEEKSTIEQKASEVAGTGNVTNQMTVKPEKPKKSDKSS